MSQDCHNLDTALSKRETILQINLVYESEDKMSDIKVLEKVKDWGGSPTGKLLVTLFITLLLMIPMEAIRGLMSEREYRRDEAVEQTISQWGGWQHLTGPVLTIPVEEQGEEEIIRHYLYILPDSLEIDGVIDSQIREKGIFEVELYSGQFQMRGTFTRPENPLWNLQESKILWDEARLILGLGDVKGLSQSVDLQWNSSTPRFEGGTSGTGLFYSGISAPVDIATVDRADFEMEVQLKGGGSIHFLPMAGETTVSLQSDWSSPGFTGSFLPTSRQLEEGGFSSRWEVQALARNYPQHWLDNAVTWNQIWDSRFGVDFLTPIDGYFKSHRAIKYSLLFVLLPFVTLFLFEIFAAGRMHPLQYIMIGLAVCMFFLMLLTLSEHMAFSAAYFMAAAGSALLIAFYTGAILKNPIKGGIMAILEGVLYLYLYMALASEDYALLIGSIGLFAILAAVMIFTRKIDWYGLSKRRR